MSTNFGSDHFLVEWEKIKFPSISMRLLICNLFSFWLCSCKDIVVDCFLLLFFVYLIAWLVVILLVVV